MLHYTLALMIASSLVIDRSYSSVVQSEQLAKHQEISSQSTSHIEDLDLLNRIIEASQSIGMRDTFYTERVARYSSQIEQMPRFSVPMLKRTASALDAWSDYGRGDPAYAPATGWDALKARQKLKLTFVLYVLLQLELVHPEYRENPGAYFALVPVSKVYRGEARDEDWTDRSPWERHGDEFKLAPFVIPITGRSNSPSSNARFLESVLKKYFDDKDPPTQSKSTTKQVWIGSVNADDLHYVIDVLIKAEIVAAITHSHGSRSIQVFESEMDRVVKMLKEDSKLHGYKFMSIEDEQFTDSATYSEPMIEDLALLNQVIEASMSIGMRDTLRNEGVARYSSQIEQMPQISIPMLNRTASALDAWSDYRREDNEYAQAKGLDALRAREKLRLTFVLYVLLQLEKTHPEYREDPDAYYKLVPVSMVYRGEDRDEDRSDPSPWERRGDGFKLAPFVIPVTGRSSPISSNARFLDSILKRYFDDKEATAACHTN